MTMTKRTASDGLLTLVALVLTIAMVSCSDSPSAPNDPSGPQPGVASVSASSNPAGAAAFVLKISGGPVEEVGANGGAVYWQPSSDGAVAAVMLGEAASGDFATVRVPDVRSLSDYRVTVVEASDTANEALSPGAVAVHLHQ